MSVEASSRDADTAHRAARRVLLEPRLAVQLPLEGPLEPPARARHSTRSVRDLKVQSVAVSGMGLSDQIFVASMAAYVGLELGIIESSPQKLITQGRDGVF